MPDLRGDQERQYRRGLVLGLSLAEVALIVVFALLLLFWGQLKDQASDVGQDEIDRAIRSTRAALGHDGGTLPEAEHGNIRTLVQLALDLPTDAPTEPERSLLSEMRKLQKTSAGHGEEMKEWDRLKPLVAQKMLQKVDLFAEEASKGSTERDQASAEKSAEETIDDAIGLLRAARAAGVGAGKAETWLSETREAKKLCDEKCPEISGGRGTEHPACWTNEDGKPEYIFTTRLTSTGVVVRDNALPHRREQQALLPLSGIGFDHELNAAEFLRQMRPLFDWCRRQSPECRFFVEVVDETQPEEKSTYKRLLRTVGDRFYYFEDLRSSVEPRP